MLDVLGVLIAFVSVILLLSMVVTALVQATKSLLRLRGRNLLVGVASLLDSLGDRGSGDSPGESENQPANGAAGQNKRDGLMARAADLIRGWTRNPSKQRAASLLNNSRLASVDTVIGENDLTSILAGPKLTWADPEQLADLVRQELSPTADTHSDPGAKSGDALGAEGDAPAEVIPADSTQKDAQTQSIETGLKSLEPAMTNRLQFIMRMWTIFWALLVAGAYQVSAPELISSLSNNPNLAAAYGSRSDEVLGIAETFIGNPRYYEVGYEALDQLAVRYPDHAGLIDEVGIVEGTMDDLVTELENVTQGHLDATQSKDVAADYRCILSILAGQGEDCDEPTELSDISTQLAAFDIEFWGRGLNFYRDPANGHLKFDAIFGVLLTAILLTFGAPFWYEQLRTLAALRDPRSATRGQGSAESTSGVSIVEGPDGSRQINVGSNPNAATSETAGGG